MTSNYQYASPRYGRRYHRNLGYLGYQGRTEDGGLSLGYLEYLRRKPGRWVSGVPRVPGQEGR